MTDRAANLNTASRMECPNCGRTVPVTHDSRGQVMCNGCGTNIGCALADSWEDEFPFFYDGTIPATLRKE